MKLQNWAIVSWLSRCCLKRACQSRTLAGQEEHAMRIVILAKSLWSRKTVQENYNAICDQVAAKLHGGGVRLRPGCARPLATEWLGQSDQLLKKPLASADGVLRGRTIADR